MKASSTRQITLNHLQTQRTNSQVRTSKAEVLSPLTFLPPLVQPWVEVIWNSSWRKWRDEQRRADQGPTPMVPCLIAELHLGEGRRLNANSGSEFWLFLRTRYYSYWIETVFVTSRHFRAILPMSRQRNYEVYYEFSSRIKERESFSKKKKKK